MTTTNISRALLVLVAVACSATAGAATVKVGELATLPDMSLPTPGVWYKSDVRAAGTAEIVGLAGLGGDLETNAPLPVDAVQLTTGFDNADKGEIGTFGDFGAAATSLASANLGYSYYKQTVVGGNATAAPSLKLGIFSPIGTGDNFGQLIYEPSWNQPAGGSTNPPADAWQTVLIDASTGSTDGTGTGGWWWTGGFGVVSSGGGPPIRSLSEWIAEFTANDPTDFATARVVSASVGVGSFNPGQIGYVDNVTLDFGSGSTTYDFERVPEPTSLALLLLSALGAIGIRRR